MAGKLDDCVDEDEAFVAELMADETYVEGKRDKLPKGFAGGRTVYLAHIFVYRDHLPGDIRRPIGTQKSDGFANIIWRLLAAQGG